MTDSKIKQIELLKDKVIGIPETYFDNDAWVVKSKALAKAYYNFDLIELKIFEAILSLINPREDYTGDKVLLGVRLHASEISDITGIEVKNLTRSLKTFAVKVHTPFFMPMDEADEDYEEDGWTTVPVAYTCTYMPEKKILKFVIHPEMYPHISMLGKNKEYAKNKAAISFRFRSKYALRLFHLATLLFNESVWLRSKTPQHRRVPLKSIHASLGLYHEGDKAAVKSSYVTSVATLNRNILMPAKEEVNKLSPLNLSITPYRIGRKIGGYTFCITSSETNEKIINGSEKSLDSSVGEIKNTELDIHIISTADKDFIAKLSKKHDTDRLLRNAKYMQERITLGEPIKNKNAYFKFLVDNDIANLPEQVDAFSGLNKRLSNVKKTFLRTILTPAWPRLNDRARQDIIDHRFDGMVFQVYKYFEAYHAVEDADSAIMAVHLDSVIAFLNKGDLGVEFIPYAN